MRLTSVVSKFAVVIPRVFGAKTHNPGVTPGAISNFGRLPVQFHQLEPDTNDVRIAIAVQVVVLLDRVERQ